MAGMAEDEGFTPTGGHDMHPNRLNFSSFHFQIREFPDVVNLAVLRTPADFTRVRQYPFE